MNRKIEIPETFSGPMGLLHELVLRNEIDIYDIPIGRLATEYLQAIGTMEFINVDEEVEFLNLASRLHEIKMRMLLPPEDRPEGEEDDDEDFDPRSGLVEALLEYRRFKDAAKMLADLAEEQARRYPRVAPKMEFRFVGESGESVDCLDLFTAFQGLLDRMSAPNEIPYYEKPISARVDQIRMVLSHRDSIRFSFLLSDTPDVGEMVGLFIAVLELVRQRFVFARQTGDFSDIILEKRVQHREEDGVRFHRARPSRCFPAAFARVRRDGKPLRVTPAVFPPAAPGGRRSVARGGRPVPVFALSFSAKRSGA
ncbi:MAG: segregation/condensation protein A [Planctomycetaceae bacterium]|nr:segregation/condensation protein A [Planctomycetaceae bacterium]